MKRLAMFGCCTLMLPHSAQSLEATATQVCTCSFAQSRPISGQSAYSQGSCILCASVCAVDRSHSQSQFVQMHSMLCKRRSSAAEWFAQVCQVCSAPCCKVACGNLCSLEWRNTGTPSSMSSAQLSCRYLLLISAQMHLGLATPLLKSLHAYAAHKGICTLHVTWQEQLAGTLVNYCYYCYCYYIACSHCNM